MFARKNLLNIRPFSVKNVLDIAAAFLPLREDLSVCSSPELGEVRRGLSKGQLRLLRPPLAPPTQEGKTTQPTLLYSRPFARAENLTEQKFLD